MPLNTLCNVDTGGIFSRVNPNAFCIAESCVRPHWAMAYRLRGTQAISNTDSVKTAPNS